MSQSAASFDVCPICPICRRGVVRFESAWVVGEGGSLVRLSSGRCDCCDFVDEDEFTLFYPYLIPWGGDFSEC